MSSPGVKVCGICRVEDAQLAVMLGASAIGFIFWPSSPRYCDPVNAQIIASTLPPHITPVGVFVDQRVDEVIEIADRVPLGAVQLHGNEAVADFERVRQPLIKALAVTHTFTPGDVDSLPSGVTVRRNRTNHRLECRRAGRRPATNDPFGRLDC